MEILFMVFMTVVSIMVLFAVMVVFRDIVKEILVARRERDAKNASAQQEETPVVEQPVVEAVAEPVVEEPAPIEQTVEEPIEEAVVAEEPVVTEEAAEEPEPEEDEGTVKFAAGQKQTLEEKYLALSAQARGWFDEIIKYASAVEGSKRFKNVRYEEYKVGKNRLVRLLIKRGIIHCEFSLQNSDFKNYVSENKISVRQSATVMRVENEATVDAVKNSIDIAVAAIAEEKEYKKQQAREKRKAARALESAQKEQA